MCPSRWRQCGCVRWAGGREVRAVSEVSLSQAQRVHMVGIGGAGMRAVATLLLQMGKAISGSELSPSPTVESLRAAGESGSLPTLSRLSVSKAPGNRLRHWCSSRYLRIPPLHREFHCPLACSSCAVSADPAQLSRAISQRTCTAAYAPFTPNKSAQRLHPPYYRGCGHVVSHPFGHLVPTNRYVTPALLSRLPLTLSEETARSTCMF